MTKVAYQIGGYAARMSNLRRKHTTTCHRWEPGDAAAAESLGQRVAPQFEPLTVSLFLLSAWSVAPDQLCPGLNHQASLKLLTSHGSTVFVSIISGNTQLLLIHNCLV